MKATIAVVACWASTVTGIFGKQVNIVADFGADPTGAEWANDSMEKALNAGADTIIIPPGIFLFKPIKIQNSFITIVLEEGATWQAYADDEDYLLRRHANEEENWPLTEALFTFPGGREDGKPMRYEAFVAVVGVENVRIMGSGVIKGGGGRWWLLYHQNRELIEYTRPRLLEFRNSQNIVIEGITLEESPFWSLHIFNCLQVLVERIRVVSPPVMVDGTLVIPNQVDGVDLNSCVDCTVRHSFFDTHDDAIAIKSGMDMVGIEAGLASHNIDIYNNTVRSSVAACFAIGSEMSGGVSNVRVWNLEGLGCRYGVRMKSAPGRGGVVEGIDISEILMRDTWERAVELTHFGGNRHTSITEWSIRHRPIFRNIQVEATIEDDTSRSRGILIEGDHISPLFVFRSRTFIEEININVNSPVATACFNAKNVFINERQERCVRGSWPYLQELWESLFG